MALLLGAHDPAWSAPATAPVPAALDAAEAASLDGLFGQGLFDPTGRAFVRFKLTMRNLGGQSTERPACGWLVEPTAEEKKAGGMPWAVLLTGEAVPVTGGTEPADFVDQCNAIMDAAAAPMTASREEEEEKGDGRHGVTIHVGYTEVFVADPLPALYLAAWLKRLGHDEPAARMVQLVRSAPKRIHGNAELGSEVPAHLDAEHWSTCAVHAYLDHADAEALFYVRRLVEYFPESVKEAPKGQSDGPQYPQGPQLLADLQRRLKDGTFGKSAGDPPADLANWAVDKRVAYLIQHLDDADYSHSSGFILGPSDDWHVKGLIEIGEPAVPALIDCVENDRRLTHMVEENRFGMSFRDPPMVTVSQAALDAALSILHTYILEPHSKNDYAFADTPQHATAAGQRLRAYWKTYGRLPFDERMMAFLTDDKTIDEARREAADNLASLGEKRIAGVIDLASTQPAVVNPAIAKFKNPTVAEAILAAMDRDLDDFNRDTSQTRPFDNRAELEQRYFWNLVHLGDRSIVPALRKRLEHPPSPRMRRRLVAACLDLGDPRPMALFADEVRMGKITIPEPPQPRNSNSPGEPPADEIGGIVQTLTAAVDRVPAADAAMYALADPTHPLDGLYADGVRGANNSFGNSVWFAHPAALRILQKALDDVGPTGVTDSVYVSDDGKDGLMEVNGNSTRFSSLPDELHDPASRRDKVIPRVCDAAAQTLSALIIGSPNFHPLLKDSQRRLNEIRTFIDAHRSHLRRALEAEVAAVSGVQFDPMYILDVRPLDRGATAQDVADGHALFHFNGQGTPLPLKLPATALIKRDQPAPGQQPTSADVAAGRASQWSEEDKTAKDGIRLVTQWTVHRVLVVQAERAPDGKIYYGVISRHDMRQLADDELVDLQPLAPSAAPANP